MGFRVTVNGQTNKAALQQFAAEKSAEFEKKKAEALEYAKANNIPIFIKTGDVFMELMFIDKDGQPQYYITENANSSATISTNRVNPGGGAGLNLDGSGMNVHEWDGGAVRATHQEFGNRVTQVDGATTTNFHATHVCGTIIASGVQDTAKGMASAAILNAYDWNNDESEMATAGANGALVSNHSYGYGNGWVPVNGSWVWYGDPAISTQEDYSFGFYDSQAKDWDIIAKNAPEYLIVKSAGNDRGNGPTNGTYPQDGPYDCIGNAGNAKNVLTVGAVNDIPNGYSQSSDVTMSIFSSWGPSDDGRIKPDICANGVSLYSTVDDNDTAYATFSGTSMAAPSVTGSLILLQEHYQNLNGTGNFMHAATLKALVIHTADEAGPNPGPDYMFGWGLMNTESAAAKITEDQSINVIDELTLNDGGSYMRTVSALGGQPLVVTIVWTDIEGTPVAASLDPPDPMIVNELDLRITQASNTYYPWSCDRLNNTYPATNNTENNVDNVEMVHIDNPVTNTNYTIMVDHDGSLSGGSQAFSIIFSGAGTPLPPATDGDLTHYEYWFDNNTLQKTIIGINPEQTLNLNTVISAQSLPHGLHIFHIRFKDFDQQYSETLSHYFYHDANVSDTNNKITDYEYWFDNLLNSRVLNSVTPSETVILNETINFDSISRGLHTFHIRFKDYNENWSATLSKLIYKIPNTLDSNNKITEYEYWFDEQYSSKTLSNITPTTTLILDETINFDSISRGLHTFHIRFKDINESWSAILNKVFYKNTNVSSGTNQIVSYRYWFNNNESSLQFVNLGNPVNTLDQILNIEIPDSLDFGTHQITMQFKDTSGFWSIPITDDFIYSPTIQEIALMGGWNIMSFYVTPDSINMMNIVQPLIDSSNFVKVINETGGFIQEIPSIGWMNTIGNMVNTEGYYIKLFANDTLSLTGTIVSLPCEIPLQAGWNIMGYPLQTSQDAMTAIQSLIDSSHLVKVIDGAGGFIQNIPGIGWMNTIGNFDAGEGYYLKVNANDTLVLNETFLKAPHEYSFIYEGENYNRISNGNPFLPMHIIANFEDYVVLAEGDELGVFINEICIGSAYVNDPLSPVVVFLTTDDPTTETIDGGKEGDIMTFKLTHLGKEYELQCQNQNKGDLLYSPLGTMVLTFTINSLNTSENIENNFYVSEIIPNPMAHKAKIYVNIPEYGNLKVDLLDIRGIVVKQLYESEVYAQKLEIQIERNDLEQAMYFVLVHFNNHRRLEKAIRKVIVNGR